MIGHVHAGTVLAACLTDTPLVRVEPPSATGGVARSELATVASTNSMIGDALLRISPRALLDLSEQLGSAVESLPAYEGIGW